MGHVEAIEISRGPNANVFGSGSAGGTVNIVPATASLSQDRAQVMFRGDSLGGHRSDLDVSRALVQGKLAFRVSGAFQHDGYVRRPSGTDTVRSNGMIRARPFPWTTLNASYSHYRMNGNRPNSMMPRDGVSYWIQRGRPAWDPVTQTILLHGVTIGNGGPGTTTPLANNQTNRYLGATPAAGVVSGLFTNQPLFTTIPSLRDQAMYDWSSINLGAMNRLMDRTLTAHVQLQQVLLNRPRQTLVAQVDWLREDSLSYLRNIYGTGSMNQIMVDVNARLLDGSPNPFFGRPFIGVDQWLPKRSPSFEPDVPARDLLLRALPNPHGQGRDYGFWLNLMDERLVLRVNRYETKLFEMRNGNAGNIANRALQLDVYGSDAYQLEDQARTWVAAQHPEWDARQIQAEAARQIGLPIEVQEALVLFASGNASRVVLPGIAATQDTEARGTEIELNYNPSRFWTIAASVTETRTTISAKKIGTNVQLNVRNLQEGGRLQPVGAYPDGTPNVYRIIDPRLFVLQVKFEL